MRNLVEVKLVEFAYPIVRKIQLLQLVQSSQSYGSLGELVVRQIHLVWKVGIDDYDHLCISLSLPLSLTNSQISKDGSLYSIQRVVG